MTRVTVSKWETVKLLVEETLPKVGTVVGFTLFVCFGVLIPLLFSGTMEFRSFPSLWDSFSNGLQQIVMLCP